MNKTKMDLLTSLVEQKSKIINITSLRTYDEIWNKHILDSLEVMNTSSWKEASKGNVLDIGTGGGFPGLPLAIEFPASSYFLLDSTKKKLDVVKDFADILKLDNVNVIWGRAEDLSKSEIYSNKFDVVVSRAVAYLPLLISLSSPFLTSCGMAIFWKTYNEDEINEGQPVAVRLNLELLEKHIYKINGDNRDRVILVYRKTI